jgi:DNA invertase Pin-like site-specific DNA recombinase
MNIGIGCVSSRIAEPRSTRLGDCFSSVARYFGTMMMQMIGTFLEFERAMIGERTRAGLSPAQAQLRPAGRYHRQRSVWPENRRADGPPLQRQ